MAVIIRPVDSPAELVTAIDVAGAQFDPGIDHADQRRFAELQAAHLVSANCCWLPRRPVGRGRRHGLHVPMAGGDRRRIPSRRCVAREDSAVEVLGGPRSGAADVAVITGASSEAAG